MYFSTEQAISIDSLVYAISCLKGQNAPLKEPLMAALIHAYSYNSAGTGHFAQFRDMSTLSSVKDVFHYRKQSVIDYFLRKAEEIIKASQNNKFPEKNKAFHEDYERLLNNSSVMKNVGMVYADPPYSFVHYSRFYHAIENLARYDYPAVEHKGRYRGDRHQSPFCIKTKAPGAFARMFEASYKYRKPILVSYSNTGMISLENLVGIARRIGFSVSILEIDHKHSTMGRLKDKSRNVKEALILCLVD
jgi:adenine-specific DNA-methyltransferase